ncbi:MAG: hypothetical protein QGF20_02830 [Alphaproteobacteria bacterium]|jgi:hypothetical protein|nr:hypothetical protein [Alphaproteobacteria bacterium]|tara:strand:+ start:137 stop:337 length:201 start_codon:yes stop_codon:yes gene_type:complete
MADSTTLYRFHWPGGATNEGRGEDVADALEKLGFGAASAQALDYYEVIEESPSDRERHELLKRAYQ